MAQAVRLEPNDADAQFFLGTLYLMEHDTHSALMQYEKLKAINPLLAEKLYKTIYHGKVVNVVER